MGRVHQVREKIVQLFDAIDRKIRGVFCNANLICIVVGGEKESLAARLTGARSRRLEGTKTGHQNCGAMASVGVRVEPAVRLGRVGRVGRVHSRLRLVRVSTKVGQAPSFARIAARFTGANAPTYLSLYCAERVLFASARNSRHKSSIALLTVEVCMWFFSAVEAVR